MIGALKKPGGVADVNVAMATSNPAEVDWTVHPMGKTLRVAIAIVGMIAATALLTISPLATNGSWILILTGVALVITSVRVAINPSLFRIAMLSIPAVAVPFVTHLL